MTRIATFASHGLYVARLMDIQDRIHRTQVQVASGQKSIDYAGLGGATMRLVNMENQRDAAEHHITTNRSAELQLKVMQGSLEAIRDTVNEFRSKLREFSSGSPRDQAAVDDIQRWAFRAMKDMESYLNVSADGKYVFSGGRTSTRPIDLPYDDLATFQAAYDGSTSPYPTTRAGSLATGYYQGDDQQMRHRVDEDRQIVIGLNAADPAFEKAMRAMAIIAQGAYGDAGGGGLENNMDRVGDAMWLLNDAVESTTNAAPAPYGPEQRGDLESAGRVLGFNQVLVQDAITRSEKLANFLGGQIDAIEQTNMPEAISRLNDDARALEMSYAAMAKVQAMSLVQYLK